MKRTPAAATLEKEQRALDLHRAGLSYGEIANHIGVGDRSAARKVVQRAVARGLYEEPMHEVRAAEADRLNRLNASMWAKAMRGDAQAARVCLQIMERRAKLLGLDAPEPAVTSDAERDLRMLTSFMVALDLDDEQALRATSWMRTHMTPSNPDTEENHDGTPNTTD